MRVIIKGKKELDTKLSRIESKLLTRKIMGQMGAEAVSLIFKRTTEDGKDKFGKPFQEYSDNYLKRKKKRGGKFFSSDPNLFDGGDMMGNLNFVVEGRKRLFLNFPKTEENLKASGHINGSRKAGLPRRDFFGTTTEEEKKLLLIPDSHLKELMDG